LVLRFSQEFIKIAELV